MTQQKETKAALAAEVARLRQRVAVLEAGPPAVPREEQVRQAIELLAAECCASRLRAHEARGEPPLPQHEQDLFQRRASAGLSAVVASELAGLVAQTQDGSESILLGIPGTPYFFPFLEGLDTLATRYVTKFLDRYGASPLVRQAPGRAQ